jgi:O-antigen ligase
MIFETVALLLVNILIITFIFVMLKIYNISFLYFLFHLTVAFMINLEGISMDLPMFSSMDILVTSFLMIIFSVQLISTKISIPKYFIAFFIYIASALISLFWSPVIVESFLFILRQIFFGILMLIVLNYKMSFERLGALMKTWIVFSILPGIIAIFQVATKKGILLRENVGSDFWTRGYGLTSHPNFLAYYLMITILLLVILYSSEIIHLKKRYFVLILIIDFTALLITFSRGALIGLIIGLSIYFIIKDFRYLIWSPILFLIAALTPGVRYRLLELFDVSKLLESSSFAWRLMNWLRIIEKFDETIIIFGSGLKSAQYYFAYAPHNEYLGFLFENGLIGFLAFYSFLVYLFISYYEAYKNSLGREKQYFLSGIILLVVVFIVSIADNFFMLPSTAYYFWFYNGLLLGLIKKGYAKA